MIRLAILLLLIPGAAWAIDVPVAPKEKRGRLMDILDQAGRECRAMGPLGCRTIIAPTPKESR
jgi:hypothetical protein